MKDEITELRNITSALHPVSTEALDAFVAVFSPYSAKRKEAVTITGAREKYLYFVTAGVQRIFSVDDAAKESTIIFTYPYSFGGVLDSFMLQQPSRYHYEPLTASTFLRASFGDLQKLRDQFPVIEVMLNKGLSLALSGVLERLTEIQSLGAEDKLKRMFSRSPHLFNMVPHKYLAEYLGMDSTNFSKFMNRVRL